MDEQLFEFESHKVFVISGQGVVFVGRVRAGMASVGDQIQFDEQGGQFVGVIRAIEHERKLKDQTIDGTEIGIMLSEFSETELGKKLSESNDVQAEFAKRGIKFPVALSLAPNGRHVGLWESIRKLMGLN